MQARVLGQCARCLDHFFDDPCECDSVLIDDENSEDRRLVSLSHVNTDNWASAEEIMITAAVFTRCHVDIFKVTKQSP